jgi:hypothetical protein
MGRDRRAKGSRSQPTDPVLETRSRGTPVRARSKRLDGCSGLGLGVLKVRRLGPACRAEAQSAPTPKLRRTPETPPSASPKSERHRDRSLSCIRSSPDRRARSSWRQRCRRSSLPESGSRACQSRTRAPMSARRFAHAQRAKPRGAARQRFSELLRVAARRARYLDGARRVCASTCVPSAREYASTSIGDPPGPVEG